MKAIIKMTLLAVCCMLFCSCTTSRLITTTTHDTTFVSQIVRDSVYIYKERVDTVIRNDSVNTIIVKNEKGDTVFVTKEVFRYRDIIKKETDNQAHWKAKADSTKQVREATKEDKETTASQTGIGAILRRFVYHLLVLAAASICLNVILLKRRT